MKILVAIDDSMFSEAAIRVMSTGIRPEDAEVLLLHVIETTAFLEQDPNLCEGTSRPEQWLRRAAQELEARGFQKVETCLIKAEIRTGILDVAEEWQPDLIVVGSHGRRGLDRFLIGSVAEPVAFHAYCSVLIVRVPLAPCGERVQKEYRIEPSTAAA